MKVNTNIIIASSDFSGFKNYNSASFSSSYAGGNIAAGGVVGPIRATTLLNNSSSVSQIQVQFSGLETFYRILPGTFFVNYPSSASTNYQIELFSYFQSQTLTVDAYVVNETGGIVSVPAVTFNCRAFLYQAPF